MSTVNKFYPTEFDGILDTTSDKFAELENILDMLATVVDVIADDILDKRKKERYTELSKHNIHTDQEINRIIEKEFYND